MREILFRGKRTHSRQWAFGFYTQSPSGNYYITETACGVASPKTVEPETVGQFTGLTDKNGKKIFEGDIIKIPDDYDEYGHNAGEIYEVYFCLGGFRLKPKYSKARGYWLEDDETVEVIGNIHDNPELLENP